jgi:hypothetical protein
VAIAAVIMKNFGRRRVDMAKIVTIKNKAENYPA